MATKIPTDPNGDKPITIKLRDVPEDVFCIIVQEQQRLKLHKKIGQCSFGQAIYSLLRAYKRCEK